MPHLNILLTVVGFSHLRVWDCSLNAVSLFWRVIPENSSWGLGGVKQGRRESDLRVCYWAAAVVGNRGPTGDPLDRTCFRIFCTSHRSTYSLISVYHWPSVMPGVLMPASFQVCANAWMAEWSPAGIPQRTAQETPWQNVGAAWCSWALELGCSIDQATKKNLRGCEAWGSTHDV